MAGRAVYDANCYFCHGYRGDAKTVAAETLSPPPLNFWRADDLTPARVEKAVRYGRVGTGMQSFASRLTNDEISAVAIYVASGLSGGAAYHTSANGWTNHEGRYGAAYPFVRGEILIDALPETLNDQQKKGRDLFKSACTTCHNGSYEKSSDDVFRSDLVNADDSGVEAIPVENAVEEEQPVENDEEVSEAEVSEKVDGKPKRRGGDCSRCHDDLDSTGNRHGGNSAYGDEVTEGEENEEYGPSPHDDIPDIKGLTEVHLRGRELYQTACAACHASDGTGLNWVGGFLSVSPVNMTEKAFAIEFERDRFIDSVLNAPVETSMPSFRNVLSREEVEEIAIYVERAFVQSSASEQ